MTNAYKMHDGEMRTPTEPARAWIRGRVPFELCLGSEVALRENEQQSRSVRYRYAAAITSAPFWPPKPKLVERA